MKTWSNIDELKLWITECYTIADVCRKLELVPYGENYARVKKIIEDNKIDTSHFRKGPWNKGKKIKAAAGQTLPLEELLVENSPHVNTNKLKKRLWKVGLKEQKCEICGYTENLELHHINGQPTDNRLKNLQILCPNCHAKTENFRGKNISHRNHKPANDWFITEQEAKERHQRKLEKRRVPESEKKIKRIENIICPVCGKEFKPIKSAKYCSLECYNEARLEIKGNRPDFIQLIKAFKELKSFVQVGKKYNVSDNAVRKWCKYYQLPEKTSELEKYILELKSIL